MSEMIIKRAHVKNFRILKDCEVEFEDDLSVVIGKNNVGKTSFLAILEKFLASGKPEFTFDDFSIAEQDKICMSDGNALSIDEYIERSLSLKLYISYTDTDDIGQASEFLLDLDVDKNYFVILAEYVLTYEKYRKLLDDFNLHKKSVTNRFFRDFIEKNINRYFGVRVRALEYDNEENSKDISLETVNEVISMQTIGAKRDVDNSQGRGKSLSVLASHYYENIGSDTAFPQLTEQLLETDQKLTNEYKNIFKSVVAEIMEMSYSPAEAEISVISTLAERPLFKDNTTVKYSHDQTMLPEDYNGLGYLNLIAIIFDIRIKLDKLSKRNKHDERPTPINLLFIEEPEAHTHPQMQYVFIKNIKHVLHKQCEEIAGFELQTLISTHSAHIVSQCDFQDLKYFYRDNTDGNSVKSRSLKQLYTDMVTTADNTPKKVEQEQAFRFVKQYVTLNRSELFFADKAILIEGDTERILLTAMMKKFDDAKRTETIAMNYTPLLSQNISVIEVGAYAQVFSTFLGFIGIKTVIFTDLDCAKMNSNNRAEGCPFFEATTTTNSSIKHFLGISSVSDIVAKTDDELTFAYDAMQRAWSISSTGFLRLKFQCKEKGYQPSSFEDAFLCINLDFVANNKESFRGLKNRNRMDASSTDYYVLANCCIKEKTTFALDILMHGGENNENWATPKYIEEGLQWLSM